MMCNKFIVIFYFFKLKVYIISYNEICVGAMYHCISCVWYTFIRGVGEKIGLHGMHRGH